MATSLDIATIRSHFPALDKDQIYFDNAGGSQILGEVAEAISHYLLTRNVQLGASYPIGLQSTQTYTSAYQVAASYINAPSPAHIVFGPSTTQLFRNLSQALIPHIRPGDDVILSALDHEANLASWVALASLRSANLIWWRPDTTTTTTTTNPVLLPSSLRALMTPRTRLVACTHTSNILGGISPIRAIADVVHEVPGAVLCVDAVAYAPHREVDVAALGADYYAFSWYKVYGPHLAMLYASERGLAVMASLGHYFKGDRSLEDKLGLAAGSYELVAGVPSVVGYLSGLGGGGGGVGGAKQGQGQGQGEVVVDRTALRKGWEEVAKWEEKLQGIVLEYLGSRPRGKEVTVWGERTKDRTKRVPVISFTIEGWKSRDLVLAVQERSHGRLGFRWGSFYSNRLVGEVLGIKDVDDGVVRVSLVHYNSEEEVKEWVKTLDEVLKT